MNNADMISVEEVAKVMGTSPESIRRQIIMNKTPFKSWCFRTPSRMYRYFIPRRSFEDWMYSTDSGAYDPDDIA